MVVFVVVVVVIFVVVVVVVYIPQLFPSVQICDKAGCKKGQVECGRCHGKKKVSDIYVVHVIDNARDGQDSLGLTNFILCFPAS